MTSTTNASPSSNVFYSPDQVPNDLQLDAILVLGGGVPISLEEPPIYVQRRCEDAVAVLRNRRPSSPPSNNNNDAQTPSHDTTGIPILCLSAGTAHLPQLMEDATTHTGLPIWEATSSAAYFLRQYPHDVASQQLFVETTSYDTIGNAFFARTTHTDLHGWRKLLVITNEFHMGRTKAIFDWIFGIPPHHDPPYQLYYLESPNVGLSEEAVQARRLRENQSLASVVTKLAPTYTTLSQVAHFLYHRHDLYTAHKLVERSKPKPTTTTTTDPNHDNNASDATAAAALKASYGGVDG